MGSQYTFYDFINSQGENEIFQWLNSIGGRGKDKYKAKIRFNNILLYLEGTHTGNWRRPYVDTLHGECSGLYEIRKEFKNVQYRLIGFHGPGQAVGTLILGTSKKGDLDSQDCQRAQEIKDLVLSDPNIHRKAHDWS